MTLEDFFTLTEMKDGLLTSARVKELISVIQQQNGCVITNVGDAARQWSVVATTLAATESKDCLDLFVQLDGFNIFNKWLQEVQKYHCDDSDNVPDLLETLLFSLEKLPFDLKKLNASEIGKTMFKLLSHDSISVKTKARILVDKWNLVGNDDASQHDGENDETRQVDVVKAFTDTGVRSTENLPSRELSDRNHDERRALTENLQLGASKDDASTSRDLEQVTPQNTQNLCDAEVSIGSAPISICSFPDDAKRAISDDQNDPLVSKVDAAKEMSPGAEERTLTKSHQVGACENTDSTGMCPDTKAEVHCVPESSESVPKNDLPSLAAEHSRAAADELKFLSHPNKKGSGETYFEMKGTARSSGHTDGVSCKVSKSRKDIKIVEKSVKTEEIEDLENPKHYTKVQETEKNEKTNQKSSLDLDEEFDPVAIARQVAIEVEREVVDYREPFCSSSEANSGGTMSRRGSVSPQSEQDQPVNEDLRKNEDVSVSASSSEHEDTETSKDDDSDLEGSEQELKSEKLPSVPRDFDKHEKKLCEFDLNEDVCIEEFHGSPNVASNISISLSTPKAVVAVSKGLPAPLHFEGELGWKGSAATSAFRPASPRRTPDPEANSESKPKPSLLHIDLNVAENVEDDVAVNLISAKDQPASSGLPSGDSSVEVNSKRAERLGLDLNRIEDEDRAPCPPSFWKLNQQNGSDRCLSPASSSSARQPSVRDFNLNDNPTFGDAGVLLNPSNRQFNPGVNLNSKVDNSVITIMGSQMTVDRKEYIGSYLQPFTGNCSSMESLMPARPVIPYTNMFPPAYSYNGFGPVPAMSIVPAIYGQGNIQYMVDSRGAVITPQALGSSSLTGVPPPFLMNATPVPASFSGVGSFRPGLDLNSGLTSLDSGSTICLEEQSTQAAQPSSTGPPLKRKEPDYGWDTYPFGYKQVTSWR